MDKLKELLDKFYSTLTATIGYDKVLHALVAVILFNCLCLILPTYISIIITITILILKEVFDISFSGFRVGDLIAGLVGLLIAHIGKI